MLGGVGTALARVSRAVARAPEATPRAAMRTASTSGSIFSGSGTSSAGAELDQMAAVSTLFSVVDLKATSVAAIDWYLERVPGPKTDPDAPAERVPQHAAIDLLARPNPIMSGQELFELGEQHYSLVGETWWVVVKAGAAGASQLPLEIWPVRPDKMDIIRGRDPQAPPNRPAGVPVGYRYLDDDGNSIPLLLNDVVFMRRPDPRDPFGRGIGPVQSLLADLNSVRYSAEWNKKFFENDATPGGVVEFEYKLSDQDYDDFVRRWREQHQGWRNSFRVAILEHAKYQSVGFTQKDMQFVELRQLGAQFIQEAFRIHDHMLGKSADVNLANAHAAEYTYAKWGLVPDLQRFKGGLNTGLLPLYNGGKPAPVRFQYCSPVQEDADSKRADQTAAVSNFVALVGTGVDPAAAAELVGFPELVMSESASAESGGATPRDIAEMVQKVYLGVDKVITWNEARQLLVDAGAQLDQNASQPQSGVAL
jgi:HK97 family phage portal protein